MYFVGSQRTTGLFATYLQLRFMYLPFQRNLNLNESTGLTQREQVPQVSGHAAETPVKEHLFAVNFLAAQEHLLEILFPEVNKNEILPGKSVHLIVD